jgi:hypothetical protein
MISEYVDLIKLNLLVILVTHIMACIWISIGMLEGTEGWVNQFLTGMWADAKVKNPAAKLPRPYEFFTSIYPNAFYFILTTITTVGYGDISGTTS